MMLVTSSDMEEQSSMRTKCAERGRNLRSKGEEGGEEGERGILSIDSVRRSIVSVVGDAP